MRILHVVPTYLPARRYGGPIQSVHGLCAALVRRGHAVEVATTNIDGDGVSDVPLETPVDIDGVKVTYFPSERLRRLYYSPPMGRYFSRSANQWDAIHTHSVFLWPTSAAAHSARTYAVPLVISPRGMLVRDLIARRSAVFKRAWIALFERRNINHAAAIHVTSSLEADELLALGFSPRRIIEIANGVDIAGLGTAPASKETEDLPARYVLFLGRISWKKGLDRLVRAIAMVPGMPLVVAGNDDENYWPTIARLAAELSISDRVVYIGYVEGDRKRAVVSGATAFALASHSENFGNAVLEAMALGVPVVITPEVGLAALVARTRSGLVSPGDPAPFGEALASIVNNPGLRRELAENAATTAREFSWDAIGARMEAEYLSLPTASGAKGTAGP